MTHAYLLLGKNGDIISGALPILKAEHDRTGQKQTLIVAEKYAPLLEGCSYVISHIFKGRFGELERAIKQAKREFDEVTVLSTYGDGFPVDQRTPSFQLDQWLRAGYLESFGKLPLVFDQRDKKRETALTKRLPKQFVLVADHAESRPFAAIEEVVQEIERSFHPVKVVRLSTIKAERVYDLLAVYDRALALVSTDTMHLHLSAASKVPVLAFATDDPSLWHGSFWQPRFRFYCRCREWPAQKNAFLAALGQAVRKEAVPPPNGEANREMLHHWLECKRIPPLTMQAHVTPISTPLHAYNPSLVQWGGGTVISTRRHKQRGARTILELWAGERWKPLATDPEFSYEDMRLFTFGGNLFGSYVVSTIPANPPNCLIAFGQLKEEAENWVVLKEHRPRWLGNDFSGLSKNWVFFEAQAKLFAIQSGDPEHTVLELDGDMVKESYVSPSPQWKWGAIRGGAIIPHEGRLLRFFHSRLDAPVSRYHVGAMVMEATPPFKILAISKTPILYGSEWETSAAFHHKPRVVFPAGVIKDGDEFVLAVGVNDSSSVTVRLKGSELNL